ncbi:hypothetical protein M409DRAFT_68157 [Zasmidium cellare ATCC 36951]|uniref:DUF726-domain-containing protein n=1 Tax=Zasmidium cellare ATCC 36951 TaxID=1080233 RepID=A0A6A6C9S0_ZASCE|nr:uncharacterized protein M409DRAFT_68157 [Zasmidium cellare ATCC 36951]KAF2163894.1 hypothetical protein M409DRAFT_68157 [Zasmidium cellare ATCC 36951]
MPAEHTAEPPTEPIQDEANPTELKRVHTKEEKEKVDEPKAEPAAADEFGLPPRPPRRRTYTLEELDSPEDIKKQVIEETGGEVKEPVKEPEKEVEHAKETAVKDVDEKQDEAKDEEKKPQTPRTSLDNARSSDKKRSSTDSKDPTSPKSPSSPSASRHKQQPSVTSVSEWSHQQMAPKETIVEEEKNEEDEWQEMPAFATHRIYDDWGKVLAKEYDEVEDETVSYGTLGGAGKGYTRVQMDEDAKSATSMDDNTAYLFKEQYANNTVYDDDEEGRNAVSQMQATKELLTEGQRIAYVGVVRLSIAAMGKDMDQLERTKNSKKAVNIAVEALQKWGQKMMLRVYEHMEIDAREQIMVEQLAEHGVLPSDLTPALMANARVKNPNAQPDSDSQASSARPSLASPRPSSAAEKRVSSNPPSKPSTPAPPSEPTTPAAVDDPPPAYEQYTADELTIQNPDDIEDQKNLDIDIRWTVLCDLFLLLIADSTYDARSRTLLERVGSALSIEWQEICRFEKRVTDALEMQEQAEKENWNEDDHLEARRKAALKKRYMVMGLCTVGGGLVIGLSSGLLAPVIGAGLAAGFTAVGVTGTSTFLAGTGAAALIGTTGTLIGGKIGLTTSNRRTGAVKTYEYKPLFNNKRTNLIVTVAGWMTGKVDDVRLPFSTIDPIMGDIYSVNWEPEMLQSTGQTIQILGTEALTQTIQQILGATVLSTLMAGLSTPIVLAKISYLIDNPWTSSLVRADATGLILADSIIDRNLGVRPITLVGFSLGSRVIWSCLKELAKRGALGLVQNVYMFGSPVVANRDEYLRARSVVSGRFVNGYATNDWILGYLFRATSGGIMRVAGLASVNVNGIENIDVTEDVPGHMAYRGMMPTLLDKVGWAVESLEYTEIEDPDPENHEKRQRELLDEIEEARKQLDEQPEKKGFKAFFSRKKNAPQKKSWETYDERSQKILEGDERESERAAQESANVLFDVDAIRREALALAIQSPGDIEEIKKHLTVKEIQSTLPALKVSLPKEEHEAKKTNGSTTPNGSSRPEARHTQSHDGIGSSQTNGTPAASSTTSLPNGSHISSKETPQDHSEADISMSFEDDDPRPKTAAPSYEQTSWPDQQHPQPKQRFGSSSAELSQERERACNMNHFTNECMHD